MTDREKAIVMAYTGYAMLAGSKLDVFYKYCEEKLGRPVFTHELADEQIQNAITEAAKEDFIKLCKDDTPAVDAVQVIRCAHCKHAYFADNRVPEEQALVCELTDTDVQPDVFCSRGSERE